MRHTSESSVAAPARLLPVVMELPDGHGGGALASTSSLLFTDHGAQFAGFFAPDDVFVLGKRKIGDDRWETVRTFIHADQTNVGCALVVDGNGFLHVVVERRAGALEYRVGVERHSLELGLPRSLAERFNGGVFAPQFVRLIDGGLLLLHEVRGAEGGVLALHRYDLANKCWRLVHPNLVAGGGNCFVSAAAIEDGHGVIHLAWNWKSTAGGVHDLCYARSADRGSSWMTAGSASLQLPLTKENVETACVIPAQRLPLTPPSISADATGHPYIVGTWCAEKSLIYQHHLVRHDGVCWHVTPVTQRRSSAPAKGPGSALPPVSRAAILAWRPWGKPQQLHLLYRDDEEGRHIAVSSCMDLAAAQWRVNNIATNVPADWEPAADPIQAQRLRQIHLLVPNSTLDNSCEKKTIAESSSCLCSLIWSPALPVVAKGSIKPLVTSSAIEDDPLDAADTLSLLHRVADWQWTQAYPPGRDQREWEIAPFYLGTLALSEISPEPKYLGTVLARCENLKWEPAPRFFHADAHCIVQAYVALHRRQGDARMLAPSRARFDAILENPPQSSLDWGMSVSCDRWSWCDALFMSPPAWIALGAATGDRRYVDFANREWWAAVEKLYVPSACLFTRDESFLDLREPNGCRLFWARGNGWVAAGLARVLEFLPEKHPDRPQYIALYREMIGAIVAAQQADGLWRPGLLDPVAHPARETSGSAFLVFAIAWGLNRGLLDPVRFAEAARRGWHALAACVTPAGKLEHVQPIGAGPEDFDPKHNDWFAAGALLLAGAEVYRLASHENARHAGNASDRIPSVSP